MHTWVIVQVFSNFLTACPPFNAFLVGSLGSNHTLSLRPITACAGEMWLFIFASVICGEHKPVIINPGILFRGSWTVSLSQGLGSGPGYTGLLVKHDVPVRKITATTVAWECALGLYTQRMLSLHQSCVMDKLDWRVCMRVSKRERERERENTHLCQTHLCRCTHAATATVRRQWVCAAPGVRWFSTSSPVRV